MCHARICKDLGPSSPISFSERRGRNQGHWEEASGGRGALSNQLLAQVSRIFDFPRLCVSPKQNMQGYGALRFHLILSSPPFSEEGRRHKVSGQTVLLPQTQVGLGDKRGWSNFRARGRRYKATRQRKDVLKSSQCQQS